MTLDERPKGSATRRTARAPLVSLAVVGAAALALLVPSAFELTRSGLRAGEFWRLLTGHLAHYGLYHFAIDAGTLLALGWMYENRCGSRRWALLLGGAALAVSLVFLAAEPDLERYRGLSGVDCAAFAAAVLCEYPRRRMLSACLAALFVAKLLFEQTTGGFLFPSTGLGDMGLPVLSAHTVGAAAGFALALAVKGRISAGIARLDASPR